MTDPSLQRISDAERHDVVAALQHAAGEGRLDLGELDERLEATWAARTYGDLVPILADLPDVAAPAPPGGRAPAPRGPSAVPIEAGEPQATSLGILSEKRRAGVWRVEPAHTATAVLGAVTLDLREAVFEARETTITANSVLGSVEIVVDAETAVVLDGTPVLGDVPPLKEKVPAELHEDSPIVHVRGMAVLGSVTVTRKRMPGEKKQR